MAVVSLSRIQVRRGQENQTGVPTLAGGEFAWAADTEHLYIGLRREDGGSRDENVRILTENDLNNFFNSAATHTINTSSYVYREGSLITVDPTNPTVEYVRHISKKLDETVSVLDFGVVGLGGLYNDAEILQRAIDRLFLTTSTYEPAAGILPSKVLLFPTGVYNIDTALRLPPHTTIIGEGIGQTIINVTTNATNAFITVDGGSAGVDSGGYNGYITFPNISSGPKQPNYIHIEGLTVQYGASTSVTSPSSLISLDCSENAVVRKVRFAGNHISGDSADTGYTGVDIRGLGALVCSSENVLIDNCEFDGLYSGVKSNYDVVNPIIQNSKFYNSVRGVSFNDTKDAAADTGPIYGRILNNRFENIDQQAIYAGANGSTTSTHHISMNNQFYNVGNLGGGRSSSTGTAIITYLTDGNISVNDYFERQEYQNQNLSLSTTYHPLVEGRVALDSVGITTVIIPSAATTKLLRLPITGNAQRLVLKYYAYLASAPSTLDRTGTVTFHLQQSTSPGNTNISDDYTYTTLIDGDLVWTLNVDVGNTFYNVQVLHSAGANMTLEYQPSLMI